MKFFTRRQMRSIHKGHLARQERALRMRSQEDTPAARQPVVQLLSGNLDRLVVVAALVQPALKPGLIDRLLVLAEQEHLEALVVLTKLDLLEQRLPAQQIQHLYRSLGYACLLTSVQTGEGLEELRQRLSLGRSALCGHSGVGKSSLLGALQPELAPLTGQVSLATGKGQHTTTSVRLVRLEGGGELFDLPGLKLAPLTMAAEELKDCFPEFAACRCRYRDCLHRGEPGCGVAEALGQSLVSEQRYQSYLRILASLS
ncbi:MAG: ribosome small subunit-dependent GTPase A [Vulcanimicrobiota bacterium]